MTFAHPQYGGLFVCESIHGQVGSLVRVFCCQRLVNLYTMPGCLAGEHESILVGITMRKHGVGGLGVRHEFLHAEVGHPGVKVQRSAHAHR